MISWLVAVQQHCPIKRWLASSPLSSRIWSGITICRVVADFLKVEQVLGVYSFERNPVMGCRCRQVISIRNLATPGVCQSIATRPHSKDKPVIEKPVKENQPYVVSLGKEVKPYTNELAHIFPFHASLYSCCTFEVMIFKGLIFSLSYSWFHSKHISHISISTKCSVRNCIQLVQSLYFQTVAKSQTQDNCFFRKAPSSQMACLEITSGGLSPES